MTSASACDSFNASTSGDGALVAFESSCDFTGGNADGNFEIFQVDQTGTIVQLTDSSDCVNANPSSNGDGSAVAFESTCDLMGGNADGNSEIFLVAGIATVQLTNSAGCTNAAPSSNAAGTLVAFDSDCDLLGSNVDRSNEIFRASDQAQIVQLTDDASISFCGSFFASSNAAGDLIAFESDCDLTGDNPDQVSEILQVDVSGVVSRRTFGTEDCDSYMPSSDGAGLTLAFESDCDFVGTNSDESLEIFMVASNGVVTQVTHDDGTSLCESFDSKINGNGTVVGFTSWCNLDGLNPDRSLEVFTRSPFGIVAVTNGAACTSYGPSLDSSGQRMAFDGTCNPTGDNADASNEIFGLQACHCGAPMTQGPAPTATDALFVLQSAVGQHICRLCECDVNDNASITASDALLVLAMAVGQSVDLVCP